MEQQKTHDRFGRSQEQRERKVERLFDEICQLKMNELVELSNALCQRLSLRVIGGFVTALEGATPPAPEPKPAEALIVVVKAATGSRVEAMKNAKAILGLGLREARDFVEGLPLSMEPADNAEAAQTKAKQWIDAGFDVDLM
jgi:large subunit ribosomal protein L7/L12